MRFEETIDTKLGLRVWARVPGFAYGPHARLVQGQVVSLVGAIHDARLVHQRTLVPLGAAKTKSCPQCKLEFVETFFEAHIANDHHRSLPPAA